jgi:catechol 2,3-dioxygenase-like lactoylglutathione lyase family enzyme
MPNLKVLGFNHTSFTVSDLDRSIAFFRDLLGFELKSRGPRNGKLIERLTGIEGVSITIAFLAGPGHTVELIEYASPPGRGSFLPRMCDTGASHIALDVDGLDAAIEGSRDYGFQPLGEIITVDGGPNKGRRIVYLRSQDGITVEFLETKASP